MCHFWKETHSDGEHVWVLSCWKIDNYKYRFLPVLSCGIRNGVFLASWIDVAAKKWIFIRKSSIDFYRFHLREFTQFFKKNPHKNAICNIWDPCSKSIWECLSNVRFRIARKRLNCPLFYRISQMCQLFYLRYYLPVWSVASSIFIGFFFEVSSIFLHISCTELSISRKITLLTNNCNLLRIGVILTLYTNCEHRC